MKSEISALDLFYISKELQILKDAKIEKIFHNKNFKNELLIRFYVKDKGKTFLKINTPKKIYLTEYKEETEIPSGFAMFLRRHLKGSRLIKIEQKDFERILILEFEIKKEGKFTTDKLVLEFFGQGNIMLLNEDNKILSLIHSQVRENTLLKPGKIYFFPNPQFNPFKEDIKLKIKQSDRESIVKTLATELSFGGEYSEEICKILEIDKNKKIKDLTDEEIKKIYDKINELEKINPKGFVYEKAITPFEFKSYDNKLKEYESFCKALDEKITEKEHTIKVKDVEIKKKTKQDKLKNVLKKQKEMLDKILEDSEKYQKQGELIYEKYTELNTLINIINKMRETMSWDEIKKEIKTKKWKVKINEKNNEIIIDIKE